jgi:hypothetical protein
VGTKRAWTAGYCSVCPRGARWELEVLPGLKAEDLMMKYRIYIEDSVVDDLVKIDGDTSYGVIHAGYLEEKEIETDNIEEAVKIAHAWAADFSSDVPDYGVVIVEEVETGQHRRFEVWVRHDEDEEG